MFDHTFTSPAQLCLDRPNILEVIIWNHYRAALTFNVP